MACFFIKASPLRLYGFAKPRPLPRPQKGPAALPDLRADAAAADPAKGRR